MNGTRAVKRYGRDWANGVHSGLRSIWNVCREYPVIPVCVFAEFVILLPSHR